MSKSKKNTKKYKARQAKRKQRYKHNKTKKMKKRHTLTTPKGGVTWAQHTAEKRLYIFTDTIFNILYGNPGSPSQWYDRNVNSKYVQEAEAHFKQAFLLLGETYEFELPTSQMEITSVDSMIEALHRWGSVRKGIVTGALNVLRGRMPRGTYTKDYKIKIIQPIIQTLPTRLRTLLPEESTQSVLMRASQTPGIKNYKLKRNIQESQRYYKQQEDQYKQEGDRSKSKLSEVQKQQRLLRKMSSTL